MSWMAIGDPLKVVASNGTKLPPKPTSTTGDKKTPLVNVHVIENVFTPEQRKEIIEKITDTMVSIEGEALREVTWVKIGEVKEGNWGIGGRALHASDVQRMQTTSA
jgi:4-oxalocrotonate tautomerase